jgi:hypothetical protein
MNACTAVLRGAQPEHAIVPQVEEPVCEIKMKQCLTMYFIGVTSRQL